MTQVSQTTQKPSSVWGWIFLHMQNKHFDKIVRPCLSDPKYIYDVMSITGVGLYLVLRGVSSVVLDPVASLIRYFDR